jgi:hypothetical protein
MTGIIRTGIESPGGIIGIVTGVASMMTGGIAGTGIIIIVAITEGTIIPITITSKEMPKNLLTSPFPCKSLCR